MTWHTHSHDTHTWHTHECVFVTVMCVPYEIGTHMTVTNTRAVGSTHTHTVTYTVIAHTSTLTTVTWTKPAPGLQELLPHSTLASETIYIPAHRSHRRDHIALAPFWHRNYCQLEWTNNLTSRSAVLSVQYCTVLRVHTIFNYILGSLVNLHCRTIDSHYCTWLTYRWNLERRPVCLTFSALSIMFLKENFPWSVTSRLRTSFGGAMASGILKNCFLMRSFSPRRSASLYKRSTCCSSSCLDNWTIHLGCSHLRPAHTIAIIAWV